MSSVVNMACPHCKTPVAIAEKHLGSPVQCGKCGRSFTVQLDALLRQQGTAKAAPKTAASCRLDVGGTTSPGRVRDRNEDALLIEHLAWTTENERHEIVLVVVADGMGGHEAGDQASRIVINALGNALIPLLTGALAGQFKDCPTSTLTEVVGYSLKEANRSVFRKAQTLAHLKGMGATAAVLLVWDGQALIGHVGDTRVYHQRAGKLSQITKDQTLVARMVELGQLTPQEALTHPSRNEVSQAVGKRFDIDPAFHEVRLAPGDWLIVACDGLHAHVDAPLLQETVAKATSSAARVAEQLVAMADQRGGSDNCTVVAVRCF